MPLEYPTGVVKEHTAVREAVGIFDVSHLGKLLVTGPGAATYVNATLSNDLAKIAAGQGAVHAVLRRRDGRHRRRPDRLLARRRARAAGAQRRQLRRGRRRLLAEAPEGVQGARPPHAVRRAGGAGHEVRRGARGDRLPDRARLHVVHRGGVPGHRGRGLPHRLHRRAWLRADRAQRGRRRAVGPAARGRRARSGCCRAGSARATRCAPRWATPCTARTSPSTSPPTRPASAGPSAGRRTPSGAATRSSRRRRPGPSATCAGCSPSSAASRGPGMMVSLVSDVPLCEITSGTFSPTLKKGIGLALVPTFVDPDAELARPDPHPARGVRVHRCPSSTPRSASHEPPRAARHLPRALARRASVVVEAPRRLGARRAGAGGVRRASASPPRPTPSRGSARSGPSSPRPASTR